MLNTRIIIKKKSEKCNNLLLLTWWIFSNSFFFSFFYLHDLKYQTGIWKVMCDVSVYVHVVTERVEFKFSNDVRKRIGENNFYKI